MSAKFIKGTIIGAALGAIAGVLFAPKKGSETRQEIKEAALRTKDQAKGTAAEAKQVAAHKLDQAKKAARTAKADAKRTGARVKRTLQE